MSQSFDLRLATENLVADAQQLDVTVETLQNISVQVNATLIEQPDAYLELEYFVTLPTESLATQFNWSRWQSEQVGFKDYLWEQTCLECFLAGFLISNNCSDNSNKSNDKNKTTAYIEINASPDGQYALYEFDSYRSPAILPPKPLMQADGQTRAAIDWIEINDDSKLQIDSTVAHTLYQYQRRFRVPLGLFAPLHDKVESRNDTLVKYIHPCVILYFGDTALYFAPKHASPPDFHNRQYWTRFDR